LGDKADDVGVVEVESKKCVLKGKSIQDGAQDGCQSFVAKPIDA